jgi:hypothetical protein
MVRLTTIYERSIKLQNKPLIPREIIESDKSLQAYLEENVIQNQKHEKIRQRVAKAQRTRINHSLEAAARKIQVEPSTDSESVKQQQTKKWTCKKVQSNDHKHKREVVVCSETETKEEPREGSLVTEQIKGIVTACNNCNHIWVHHSKNLGRQYYASCPRCHNNCRLKHYKVG